VTFTTEAEAAEAAATGGSVLELLATELQLQESTINLTAASNFLSPGVLAALHPALQNVHCEGYPERRYHEGQLQADAIESLAIERAKQLFAADHANVQPYRGTTAVLAAVLATLDPGDTLLGLECRAGGHYSTGGSLHLIGRMFNVVTYAVCENSHLLDYAAIEEAALRCRPRALVCGDTAYPRQWDFERLAKIAERVDAVLIADVSQTLGLIAAGALPSPVPHAGIVVGATYKTLRGPRAGLILCRAEFAARVDRAVYPVVQGGPNLSLIAGLAAALEEAGTPAFAEYAQAVIDNAGLLAQRLIGHGFDLVTGGTDNHACLLDMRSTGLTGRAAAAALAECGIIANANQVPFDPAPPIRPSGLRLGTPAVTTLGMRGPEILELADLVAAVLGARAADESPGRELRERAAALRHRFPAPRAARLPTV
jgi:glycine hydroxymethyltransferase